MRIMLWGIRTRLHATWYVAFAVGVVITVTQFPEAYPLWVRILLGALGSFLFLVAVILRQLALNSLGLRRHMTVKNIVLFPFGGVPGIVRDTNKPVLDTLLALSGLLLSLTIAVLFYLVYVVLVITGSIVYAGLIQWLGFIGLVLAILHLVPGFPLDGGRLLRAALWKLTSDYHRATSITTLIGRITGAIFLISGVVLTATGTHWLSGLVLAFAGWTLYLAATQIGRRIPIYRSLRHCAAKDIMSREYAVAAPQLSIEGLVRDCMLKTGQRLFIVIDGTELRGIASLINLRSIPRKQWDSIQVAHITIPVAELTTAHVDQSAAETLERMTDLGIDWMPVLDGTNVVGVIDRQSLMRIGETRIALKMD